MILAFGLLALDIVIATSFLPGYNASSSVGGVDGCLSGEGGAVLLGTITISGAKIPADSRGCFFFSDLQPGIHNMSIKVGDQTLEKAVQIKRGQATHLGKIEFILIP